MRTFYLEDVPYELSARGPGNESTEQAVRLVDMRLIMTYLQIEKKLGYAFDLQNSTMGPYLQSFVRHFSPVVRKWEKR